MYIKNYQLSRVIRLSFLAPSATANMEILCCKLDDQTFYDFNDQSFKNIDWAEKEAGMTEVSENLWYYQFGTEDGVANPLGEGEFHFIFRDADSGIDYDGGIVITKGLLTHMEEHIDQMAYDVLPGIVTQIDDLPSEMSSNLVSEIWNAPPTIVTGCATMGGILMSKAEGDDVEAVDSSGNYNVDHITDTGTGTIIVNHNTGGYRNLAYRDADDNGVGNVGIEAYLTVDFNAGRHYESYCKGSTVTDSNGEWISNAFLSPGDYTFVFKGELHGPNTKRVIIEEA